MGVNLGLLYELDARTRLGLTYNSQVNLDFKATPEFSDLAPGLNALLNARGLLNASVDLGIKVPQGVMGSAFHQVNDRWAVLGSVGWQQWSKFGKAEVNISDTTNPTSLTTNLNYKDTWHFAVGAQHRLSDPWTLNFGIAYDSGFQDSANVSPALPVNSAWRFGVGGQNQVSKTFSWGVAGEYVYGGTLDVNKQSAVPRRARRARQSRRLVQQHRRLLPRGQSQLEVLGDVNIARRPSGPHDRKPRREELDMKRVSLWVLDSQMAAA